MYIERDSRGRGGVTKGDGNQSDYLARCLDLLTSSMLDSMPAILRDILGSLENVSGRKHPSTVRIKQLKAHLPQMKIVQHLVASSVFRPRLVNEAFVQQLGVLMGHLKSIDAGAMQIQSATGG
jgi:serine/threonine-protein kinase ULK4